MALFRKLFYRKPPDGLLEISERVYVFDDCLTTDIVEEEEYKFYIGGIVDQLQDQFPDANFMVFNFREGEDPTQIDCILAEYDMTVIDYPRQYEGCPLLTMEMIHHFLRSSESWLSLGQQNVLLMNCERGGWPILAFMLAALLIYRKQFNGEQRTLDMIYRQAPRELLQLMSPLNPLPSQLRYLQYISSRNVGSEWPPLDKALTLDCIIMKAIPNADGEGGCRPIFRIYGQDPLMVVDRTPKVLFSTPKKSRLVKYYKQADSEVVKIDIHCHIQGDVVLECITLDSNQEQEEMMFRVMFNTAFIRSNVLTLNREEIDILWNAKDQYPRNFKAEIIFSEMGTGDSVPSSVESPGMEEKEGLPIEAFSRVKEMFNSMDWSDPKSEVGLMLEQITLHETSETGSPQSVETTSGKLKEMPETDITAISISQENLASPSPKASREVNIMRKKIEPQDLQVVLQRPTQSKIISQRLPQSSLSPNSSLQGSPMSSSRYLGTPSGLGITALLHDHETSNSEQVTHQVTKSLPSESVSSPVTTVQKPLQFTHVSTKPSTPPSPSSLLTSVDVSKTIQRTRLSSPTACEEQLSTPTSQDTELLSVASAPAILLLSEVSATVDESSNSVSTSHTVSSQSTILSEIPLPLRHCLSETFSYEGGENSFLSSGSTTLSSLSGTSPSSNVKMSSLEPPPPPPPLPSFSGKSPSSIVKKSFVASPPATPPCSPNISPSATVTKSFSSPQAPRPPPPPPRYSGRSPSSSTKKSFSTGTTPSSSPSFSRTSPSSAFKDSFSSPPPPPPPPGVSSSAPPPPPSPLSSSTPTNTSSGPPLPPPAPYTKALSSPNTNSASPKSDSGYRNGNGPPIPGPPSVPLGAKDRGFLRGFRSQSQPRKANLKPYHWLKITRAMQGSLWAETQKPDEASKAPQFDFSELETLFSAATPDPASKGGKTNRRSGPKSEKVQLIELRRAYNCEIMLSKVKIPLPDLVSSVLALDESAFDVDQVDNLIKFCPTKEEMELLQNYNGNKENLGRCEQFFLELMKVPRVESKLRVFSFKMQFSSQVSDLRNNLNIINSASEEVRNSIKLKRIMQTILSLGNALNHGTARGSAVGFRLDSLLKLTETRARNNKMTLMHYLCKVLAEKLPELIDFAKDLVSLEASTKIQLKFLAEEMQAISKGLEKVIQELTAAERDGPVSENFCKILNEFLGVAEGEVRSLASLYSNVGRNADALAQYFGEDPARCPFEQVVSTLLNFVRMFDRAHQENCKQLEFEKKKAQKESDNEKLKISDTTKEGDEFMQNPLKSRSIK